MFFMALLLITISPYFNSNFGRKATEKWTKKFVIESVCPKMSPETLFRLPRGAGTKK